MKTADSMASAAKLWGIEKSELSRAKAGGCVAFRNSRIYRDDLLPWLQANPATEGEVAPNDYKARKLKAQVDKLELEVSRERGKLVDRNTVTEEWGKMLTFFFDAAERAIGDRIRFDAFTKECRGHLGKTV